MSAGRRSGVAEEVAASRRVLVLEGEPRTAQFLAGGLRLDGHEVVIAEDGEVGTFLAGTEHFDVFVLDLALLDGSGFEMLARIRSVGDGIPVIVLSERDDPDARQACQAAGASAFLPKPLVVEHLRAAVAEQLAHGTV
jgi:two-component system, OmpR family, response regulator